MFKCQWCSNTFTRKFNLKRHLNTKHALVSNQKLTVDESDTESDSAKMSGLDCYNCGALYRDQEKLTEHIHKCNDDKMKDDFDNDIGDDDDETDDEDDDEDETVWQQMVDEVYDTHDEAYQSKIQMYEESGMAENDAEIKASDDMHAIYRKTIMSSYKRLLIYMNDMENSAYHKRIMKDIDRFENRGLTYHKAVKVALKKNKHVFDQILNQFEPDSDDSSEEEREEEQNAEDETEDEESPMKRSKTEA